MSLKTWLIPIVNKVPIKSPRRGPPRDKVANLNIILSILKSAPKFYLSITWKITIAVPSFNKDSPSTKVLNFSLTPTSLSKATTATGSVALKITQT